METLPIDPTPENMTLRMKPGQTFVYDIDAGPVKMRADGASIEVMIPSRDSPSIAEECTRSGWDPSAPLLINYTEPAGTRQLSQEPLELSRTSRAIFKDYWLVLIERRAGNRRLREVAIEYRSDEETYPIEYATFPATPGLYVAQVVQSSDAQRTTLPEMQDFGYASLPNTPEIHEENPERLELSVGFFSKAGLSHAENQDAILIPDPRTIFKPIGVFDGVGSSMGGGKAADAAMKEAEAALSSMPIKCSEKDTSYYMDHALELARKAAGALGETTATFVRPYFDTNLGGIYLTGRHVGDSRLYVYNERYGIKRLTMDHNQLPPSIQDEFDKLETLDGYLNMSAEKKSLFDHHRHEINSWLGNIPIPEFQSIHRKIQEGDRYILATDGLTDVLSGRSIRQVMSHNPSDRDAAKALLTLRDRRNQERYFRAKDDDVSAIVFSFHPSTNS